MCHIRLLLELLGTSGSGDLRAKLRAKRCRAISLVWAAWRLGWDWKPRLSLGLLLLLGLLLGMGMGLGNLSE